jgi:hypothetical protein
VRIVLGAWYHDASIVRWSPQGFAVESIP